MLRTIIRSINTLSSTEIPLRLRRLRQCYGPVSVNRFIEKQTIITEPDCTPELLLHLLDKKSRYYSVKNIYNTKVPGVKSLYWAHYFPDILCLTRFILDHKEIFKDKSVLDFTGGCGATGIASLLSRCRYVIVNEPCIACGCAAKINALINGMPMGRFIVFPQSLIALPVKEDIVVLGEPRFGITAERFEKWLLEMRKQNKIVYAARTNFISGDGIRAEDIENERIRLFFEPIYEYELPKNVPMTMGVDCVRIYEMK